MFLSEKELLMKDRVKEEKRKQPQTPEEKGLQPLFWFYPLIDGTLAGAVFFLANFLKNGTLHLSLSYWKLLAVYLAAWLVAGWFTGKFENNSYRTFRCGLQTIIRATAFWAYIVTFVVVVLGVTAFSRLHIFGSILGVGIINSGSWALWYWRHREALEPLKSGKAAEKIKPREISYWRMAADGILLAVSFFIMNYLKRESLELHPGYGKALVFAFGLWLVSGLAVGKFERRHYPNIYHLLAPYLKGALLLILTTALVAFGLRLSGYSRLQIFGSYGLFLLLEMMMVGIIWWQKFGQTDGDVESAQEVKKKLGEELFEGEPGSRVGDVVYPVAPRLRDVYLKRFPELFDFISRHIDLQRIDMAESLVLYTQTPYNVEIVEDGSLSLFVNLHRVNDFRFLNRYFLTVHRKFCAGGYFVGCAETIQTHRQQMFDRFPQFLARMIYPLDFLWRRVFPKLPVLQKFYFFFSGGKNRALSKAELLGRLYFCGFKVLAVQQIGYQLYYIAQKVKAPSTDSNPSYGPLIKLSRVGYRGELIQVYKFRTMHPYSEYLQEYIYENYKLDKGGKFKNDFRLTEWGKLMRKLWLDELPQFINFFKGDLKLVGVRALSPHYFSLYPEEVRQMRIQQKPGLIPPYYVDLPQEFEEIVESERRYLQQKSAHPFKTDLVYFCKAAYNILVKKARSR